MTQVQAVGSMGFAPGVLVQPVVQKDAEQAKYEKMWSLPAYRDYAPGEHAAQVFLSQAKPLPGEQVIDFGAGTGRGALMLALFGGVKVTMVDFAENCLDEDVRNALRTQSHVLNFVQADLRQPIPVGAKYGFCTDVMEHIPPEAVDAALVNILKSAQHVFFQISTLPDHFGAQVGEHLHLTVQPYQWWKDKLRSLDAVIHWSAETPGLASFYVSAWQDAGELVKRGVLNTGNDEIRSQIRSSIRRGLPLARPHDRQEKTIMLLAGGPSLNQFADEIAEKRKAGMSMVTTNGAYQWAIDRGLAPSAQIIVDAQEHMARMVQPAVPECRYLLASQCHPSVFDAAPEGQVVLWHSAIDDAMSDELDAFYKERGENWYPSPGGSTVMLRAFTLLRMLGFYRFEVYGFDSCIAEQQHHAYTQAENDGDGNAARHIQVSCGDRIFHCTPWMASQAQEFIDLIRFIGDEIELVVHGDGLIAHIIKTAAESGEVEITATQ